MRRDIIIIVILLVPFFTFGQNASLNIYNGAYLNSNSIIDVDGAFENNGHLINQNEIYVKGDFFSQNSYQGLGRLIVISNSDHFICYDTIHDLTFDYLTTEVNLDDDLFIRNNLTLNEGKVNLTGAILHLNNEFYSQNLIINSPASFFYNGSIRQNLSEDGNYDFPLGTIVDYTPINIDVDESDYSDKWIEVKIEESAHPDLPNSNDFLSMYWSINNSSFNASSLFSIEAVYPEAFISGDESDFKAEVFMNPGWLGTNPNSDLQEGIDYFESANNLVQLNDISQIGDFVIFTRISGCAGDVNLDGSVNILDLVIVSSNFGCSSMCEGDANGNGQVDILDLVVVSSNFGNTCQ